MEYCIRNEGAQSKVVLNLTIAPGQCSRPLTPEELAIVWREPIADFRVVPVLMEASAPIKPKASAESKTPVNQNTGDGDDDEAEPLKKTAASAGKRGRTKLAEE